LKPSGLYYLELLPGTGAAPVVNDTAIIYYKTTYLDGFVLFTNQGDIIPYSFIVGYAPVLGLEEAIRYMKVGGKSKILTPSYLAYGSYGIPGFLAGYTPLLWEIELLAVKPGSKK
jgi:FKBP-type peptidyl-prolyl cis-trans isomerase